MTRTGYRDRPPLLVTGSHAFDQAYRECLEALHALAFWRPLADTAVVSN